MSLLQKQQQKILRTLMRIPSNKKCADCGEQCAVNVDTTHGIFVCSSCAGFHREFGDRIKSVSMANFTQDEIALLQKQTNDDFNNVFMAKWNSKETPLPLNADDYTKRSFMKAKYVQKKWFSKKESQNQSQQTKPIQNQSSSAVQTQKNPFQLNTNMKQNQQQEQLIQFENQQSSNHSNQDQLIQFESSTKQPNQLIQYQMQPKQNQSNPFQNQNVKKQEQSFDLIDLNFDQQVSNKKNDENHQGDEQFLSRQKLKDLVENMNAPSSSSQNNDAFQGFRNNTNNGSMNYHYSNYNNTWNANRQAAIYKFGGFGGDSMNVLTKTGGFGGDSMQPFPKNNGLNYNLNNNNRNFGNFNRPNNTSKFFHPTNY